MISSGVEKKSAMFNILPYIYHGQILGGPESLKDLFKNNYDKIFSF